MVRLIAMLSLGGCLTLGGLPKALAQDKQESKEEEVEDLEEVEELEEIDSVATPKDLTVLDITGRMHPAAVHIPIGMIMALLVFDLLGLLYPKSEAMRQAGLVLLALIVAACLPALITGFLRAWELERLGSTSELRMWHRNLMLGFAGLCTLALVLRGIKRNQQEGVFVWIYLGLIAVAALLVSIGGHLGGKLVFGENHLPF